MSEPRSPVANLAVRAVRPADAEALAAMMNLPGFRWGTVRLPFTSPDELRQAIEKASPGRVSLVAEIEGGLVGSAGLERFSGRRGHAGAIGMGVHDSWVGRGVGTALMAALVEMADRWLGLRRLELTVFVDNQPAQSLYRRFGFAVEGTHRGFALRDGVFVDAHCMARLGRPPGPV